MLASTAAMPVSDCCTVLRHHGYSSSSYKSSTIASGRAEGSKAWCLQPFIHQILAMSPLLSHHDFCVIIYCPQERMGQAGWTERLNASITVMLWPYPHTTPWATACLKVFFIFVGLLWDQITTIWPVMINFIYINMIRLWSNYLVKQQSRCHCEGVL